MLRLRSSRAKTPYRATVVAIRTCGTLSAPSTAP